MLATGEPGSDGADRMLEGALRAAPNLILAETANALRRKARTGGLAQADAARASHEISRMFRRLVASHELRAQAFDLALRRDHPVYDCFYVALAVREGAPLLTADRRLAQRLGGDVEVLMPSA